MRDTHPHLWNLYVLFALASIAQGVNFFLLTPTFMPLSIPKEAIALTLLGCGVTKLMLLFPSRVSQRFFPSDANNLWLRRSMALSVFIFSFWAAALTIDFVRLHQTSMQLPIMYIVVASFGLLLLLQPFLNPATAKTGPYADAKAMLEKNGHGNGNGK